MHLFVQMELESALEYDRQDKAERYCTRLWLESPKVRVCICMRCTSAETTPATPVYAHALCHNKRDSS